MYNNVEQVCNAWAQRLQSMSSCFLHCRTIMLIAALINQANAKLTCSHSSHTHTQRIAQLKKQLIILSCTHMPEHANITNAHHFKAVQLRRSDDARAAMHCTEFHYTRSPQQSSSDHSKLSCNLHCSGRVIDNWLTNHSTSH